MLNMETIILISTSRIKKKGVLYSLMFMQHKKICQLKRKKKKKKKRREKKRYFLAENKGGAFAKWLL